MGRKNPKKKQEAIKRKAIVEAIRKNAVVSNQTDSMIRRIVIRDVATFGHEGVTLDDLQRVNFVYGGNGCGKTTISRLLAACKGVRVQEFESSRVQGGQEFNGLSGQFANCEVEWTEMPLKVLVYNRDFRVKNLVENIPGVFTLGEDSVEAEKRMETLQQELAEENHHLESKLKRIEAREEQIEQDVTRLRNTLWKEVLLPQQENFEECLKGAVTSKIQFARQMTAMVENGRYHTTLGHEGLKERYQRLYGDERLLPVRLLRKPEEEYKAMMAVTRNKIWQRSMVAVKSEKLTVDSGEAAQVCPLCGQPIETEKQRKRLRDYWDDMETMRSLSDDYKESAERLRENLEGMANACQQAQGNIGRHVERMRGELATLAERTETNCHIMQNKLEHPSMVAQFKETGDAMEALWKTIDETNAEVAAHNSMVENQNPERERLKEDLLTYLAGRSASTVKYCQQGIAQRNAELQILKREADAIKKKTEALVEEIRETEKKLASTKPTVERINTELKRYGFTGFSIQPTKHGNTYQIQREDGSLVKDTLSEGETTFITFLYYLQLVKGGDSTAGAGQVTAGPKVVVIDDPVSSLDNKVLGVVSDMVRQLIQRVNGLHANCAAASDINQVFVLTHNAEFYKKVTRVNPRSNKQRGCHHWWLSKMGNESKAKAYGMENPVKVGYDQLWMELKEGIAAGQPVQNTMRNIVETYFVEYGGYESKNKLVAENFADDEPVRTKMNALLEWMDQGSHGGEDAVYGESPREANARNMEVLRELFERLGHEAHYNMMMKVKSYAG